MTRALLLIALAVTWLSAGTASAYPQLTLSHDQTCTGCHLSPAGGNLLNENGLAVAESMSQFGTAPEFMYGKLGGPKWLVLGGDNRIAAGYVQSPTKVLVTIPMQIEGYANAKFGHFTIHTNLGARASERGNEAATYIWAREHYLMWQQNPDENYGLYVRAGRFMPVFGLRLVEHNDYTRRFGGTQLYADTYGVHVAMIESKFEGHLTAFIADPFIDPVEHASGGAFYGEVRPSEKLAIGAEAMLKHTVDDNRFYGGPTAKYYIASKNLLLQGELQITSQFITKSSLNTTQGNPIGIVGYGLATWQPKEFLMVDVGLGHYDENLRVKNLDRDCVDLNVHWFASSHLEVLLTNRVEMIAFGNGGPTTAYSLVHVHYRL